MKLKTSLWLIGKTDVSLEFGSSCIITAHFSSWPFIPCQAFQAGLPYAPVKTGNCFKRLKHLYFWGFWSPNCLRMFVFKRETQQISAMKGRGECESFLPPVCRVITLCLSITDFLHLGIPSVPSLPCTRYRSIWTNRDWGRTNKFSALSNHSSSLNSALNTPWLAKML